MTRRRLSDLPGPPFLFLFLLLLPLSDACSPSWFREERSVPGGPPPAAAAAVGGALQPGPGDVTVIVLPPESSSTEDVDEDYDRMMEAFKDRPCGPRDIGWCRNGGECVDHWSHVMEKWTPYCRCHGNYNGERCERLHDPNVFAAPLEVGGRSHTSLPAMSFFAILSLLTLGAALVFYRKLMRKDQWELTELAPSCSANTPFSNRSHSVAIPRRNALWSRSSEAAPAQPSPNLTCLNPALSRKSCGLQLNDSCIEIALDETLGSTVSVHPSYS